jgi:hypothetical protein
LRPPKVATSSGCVQSCPRRVRLSLAALDDDADAIPSHLPRMGPTGGLSTSVGTQGSIQLGGDSSAAIFSLMATRARFFWECVSDYLAALLSSSIAQPKGRARKERPASLAGLRGLRAAMGQANGRRSNETLAGKPDSIDERDYLSSEPAPPSRRSRPATRPARVRDPPPVKAH